MIVKKEEEDMAEGWLTHTRSIMSRSCSPLYMLCALSCLIHPHGLVIRKARDIDTWLRSQIDKKR